MRRFVLLVLALFCSMMVLPGVSAATSAEKADAKSPGLELAMLATEVTGLAISPLPVGICVFKDSVAAVLPPGLKKPLDVAETEENKISGLVAAGVVIPALVATGSEIITNSSGFDHHSAVLDGEGMIQTGAFDPSRLLIVLRVPLCVTVFAVVWVVGPAIKVLILLIQAAAA